MKIKLTAAQRKAGVDLRDIVGPLGDRPAKPRKSMPDEAKTKALPKQFRGAKVVRGLGMKAKALDALVTRHSYSEFSDSSGHVSDGDAYLVLEDKALQEGCFMEPRLFAREDHAIRYARAMSSGNVDHRVLRVSAQTRVIAVKGAL